MPDAACVFINIWGLYDPYENVWNFTRGYIMNISSTVKRLSLLIKQLVNVPAAVIYIYIYTRPNLLL